MDHLKDKPARHFVRLSHTRVGGISPGLCWICLLMSYLDGLLDLVHLAKLDHGLRCLEYGHCNSQCDVTTSMWWHAPIQRTRTCWSCHPGTRSWCSVGRQMAWYRNQYMYNKTSWFCKWIYTSCPSGWQVGFGVCWPATRSSLCDIVWVKLLPSWQEKPEPVAHWEKAYMGHYITKVLIPYKPWLVRMTKLVY